MFSGFTLKHFGGSFWYKNGGMGHTIDFVFDLNRSNNKVSIVNVCIKQELELNNIGKWQY